MDLIIHYNLKYSRPTRSVYLTRLSYDFRQMQSSFTGRGARKITKR